MITRHCCTILTRWPMLHKYYEVWKKKFVTVVGVIKKMLFDARGMTVVQL